MAKATQLIDLELILLSSASRRKDGYVHPLPRAAGDDVTCIKTALHNLITLKFLAETDTKEGRHCWQERDGERIGLTITPEGRAAIHDEEPVQKGDLPTASKSSTKIEQVLTLLRRGQGAGLEELISATGWLAHTTRAALTGLRKKGYVIAKEKVEGVTRYSISAGSTVE